MLETYFVKPQTVDRIRACWIGAEIERYAGCLSEQGYSARTVLRRVPVLAPAQLANLPAGRVVVFRRDMPPVIGRAEQAWRRLGQAPGVS